MLKRLKIKSRAYGKYSAATTIATLVTIAAHYYAELTIDQLADFVQKYLAKVYSKHVDSLAEDLETMNVLESLGADSQTLFSDLHDKLRFEEIKKAVTSKEKEVLSKLEKPKSTRYNETPDALKELLPPGVPGAGIAKQYGKDAYAGFYPNPEFGFRTYMT